jgi:hypothetical protein|tara:strand:- start:4608 stop:4748 length:141 start_codon:yes stop_codon:yes gene_type:complete
VQQGQVQDSVLELGSHLQAFDDFTLHHDGYVHQLIACDDWQRTSVL